jgi:DNA-binding response OmpR family regulator
VTVTEPKTILVVEDDNEIRMMLRIALETAGFSVESAGDGLSALERARQTSPNLIILDLNMPRMGGEDFLYAWRTGVEMARVPVIVITAASPALRPEDLGVEAFFPKPFDIDKLLWHIRDLLAVAPRNQSASHGSRGEELIGVADQLVAVMSTLLVSAEHLADAPGLSDDLRKVAATGLDAAQRAAVLARRLSNLVNARS